MIYYDLQCVHGAYRHVDHCSPRVTFTRRIFGFLQVNFSTGNEEPLLGEGRRRRCWGRLKRCLLMPLGRACRCWQSPSWWKKSSMNFDHVELTMVNVLEKHRPNWEGQHGPTTWSEPVGQDGTLGGTRTGLKWNDAGLCPATFYEPQDLWFNGKSMRVGPFLVWLFTIRKKRFLKQRWKLVFVLFSVLASLSWLVLIRNKKNLPISQPVIVGE